MNLLPEIRGGQRTQRWYIFRALSSFEILREGRQAFFSIKIFYFPKQFFRDICFYITVQRFRLFNCYTVTCNSPWNDIKKPGKRLFSIMFISSLTGIFTSNWSGRWLKKLNLLTEFSNSFFKNFILNHIGIELAFKINQLPKFLLFKLIISPSAFLTQALFYNIQNLDFYSKTDISKINCINNCIEYSCYHHKEKKSSDIEGLAHRIT